MRLTIIILFISLLLVSCNSSKESKEINYSIKQTTLDPKPIVETYFDTTIVDYFRQLENLADTGVLKWFEEQGQYADNILLNIKGRENLIKLMQEYDNRKVYHISQIEVTNDNQYFYLKRKTDEDIYKLYYRKSLDSEEELLFNPDRLKLGNGNPYVINKYSPDWKGKKVAIALELKGSDIMEIIIFDMEKRCILPKTIKNYFNASGKVAYWMSDNQGFLYLSKNEGNISVDSLLLNMKTRYYRIDKDESTAVDIFSRLSCPHLNIKPEDFPVASINSQSDKYIIGITAGPNIHNDAYYIPVQNVYNKSYNWKQLYKKEHKVIKGVCYEDDFIFLTASKASNNKICQTKLSNPDFNHPKLVIPEKIDEVIEDFKITSSGLYYTTTKNGVVAKLYLYDGIEEKSIDLPGKFGRIFIENKSYSEPDIWVSATGWLTDMKRMKYDVKSNSFSEENLVPKSSFPEFEIFTIEELSVKSHDGELVPLSIIAKKGVIKDGSNPTLLYGYGAYGISWKPYFLPDWLTWVANGGILCFSHIRGGGEKGNQWHKMGKNHNKPNSWKDFIASSEFLIENKYTSNKKLVIYGGSAGGIVIGRSMTERPDLYAAVISEVGMLNAVRFETMPSGLNHAKEFGYINNSSFAVR